MKATRADICFAHFAHIYIYIRMYTRPYTQITAAALHLYCSVFMMRRADISMGLGIVRGIEEEGRE